MPCTLGVPCAAERSDNGRRSVRFVHPVSAVSGHLPVMRDEALAGLAVRPAAHASPRIFVDATYGRGGHSGAILSRLGGGDTLYALDRDPEAVAHARAAFDRWPNFEIAQRNFAELAGWAREQRVSGRIDGLLIDLGVSSPQLDDPARGFSFAADGPLDMRMDSSTGETAAQWLARATEHDIADVLWRFGEERNSRRIAARIVATRALQPLTTTAQLAALVAAVPGPRSHKIHPATRTFQALRIHVNGELEALSAALAALPELLAPGGRVAIISFHSLEDRLVKRCLREGAMTVRDGVALPPVFARPRRYFPGAAEIARNPRARSAVLRIAERLPS